MRTKAPAVAMLFVIGVACSSSNDTTTPQPSPTETASSDTTLVTQNSRFVPSELTISAGQEIQVQNKDTDREHNFSITSASIEKDIEGGENEDVDTSELATGTYDFFCKYHQSQGMTGKLTVQ